MVDHINRDRNEHILTAEDPIEFVHLERKTLIKQLEVGFHTESLPRTSRLPGARIRTLSVPL